MFEEREDLVLEDTENVGEPTTEEMVEGKPEAAEEGKEEKKYTEAELNERVDDLVAKKLSRKEAKIRREFDKEIAPYKNAEHHRRDSADGRVLQRKRHRGSKEPSGRIQRVGFKDSRRERSSENHRSRNGRSDRRSRPLSRKRSR